MGVDVEQGPGGRVMPEQEEPTKVTAPGWPYYTKQAEVELEPIRSELGAALLLVAALVVGIIIGAGIVFLSWWAFHGV